MSAFPESVVEEAVLDGLRELGYLINVSITVRIK